MFHFLPFMGMKSWDTLHRDPEILQLWIPHKEQEGFVAIILPIYLFLIIYQKIDSRSAYITHESSHKLNG